MPAWSPLKNWILASRPKTLPAAVAPVVVGVALSWKLVGIIDWALAVCTLLSAMAIQVATNFFNDAIDFEKGIDTDERLGPVRATQSGLLSTRAVMLAAVLAGLAAAILSVPLILARGWPIIAIGIPSLYFSFGYTGGPFPLAYQGLGELFVVLFFGFVAVTGTVFVQTGEWLVEAMVLGFQVGLLSTVLIAVNNLRDFEEDSTSGKRTLAVRFGTGFGRLEIVSLCLIPPIAGVYWWYVSWSAGFLVPLISLLPGLFVMGGVFRHAPGRIFNKFLGLAALQLVAFSVLFTMACIL